MKHNQVALWCVVGLLLAAVSFSPPASAQKSEQVQQLEVIRDIVDRQSKSIEVLATALASQANKPPVVISGMVPQAPAPVIIEEKPCEDTLAGCFLRGVGSLLARGGNKAIDFLDRNTLPIAQLWGNDRASERNMLLSMQAAEYGYRERTDVARENGLTNRALGMNMQNVAQSGFGTLATSIAGMQPQAVNTYNVNGTGINFGNGTLNYNPVTGSYNPVNPASRTCAIVNNVYSCL